MLRSCNAKTMEGRKVRFIYIDNELRKSHLHLCGKYFSLFVNTQTLVRFKVKVRSTLVNFVF